MSKAEDQIGFFEILEANGYDPMAYQVILEVYDDNNQLLVVLDHVNNVFYRIPVEDNVLTWHFNKIASTVVAELERAKSKNWPDYL